MSMMDVYSFGELLATLRKQRRISQNDLAAKLDVHRNTIGKWERGIVLPESKTIVLELAKQLRLDEQETRHLLETSLTAVSPSWNVPHQRNPFFTGRSTLLVHLHTMLTNEPTIAALTQSYGLAGLGGIGKTQLAIEYAYQYRSTYEAVLWVEAETQTSLVSSFLALAVLLALPEKSESDQSKIVAAVLRWLNRHQGWLLIFDNIEDLALLKPFLPASNQGALLLTTRLQSLGTLAQRVELPPMTIQEGCDFLLARINRRDQGQGDMIDPQEQAIAQQIVSELGGLPLALEQAGSYIETTQSSLSDYLYLFQTAQQRLLSKHEPSSTHPLSVSRTFLLAFERVQQRNPLAADLLTVCAFLAPDVIPERFFLEGASSLGPTFAVMMTDPLAFPEAITVLLSYSLLQRHPETGMITVHRLVQAVLKGHLSEGEQRTWARQVMEVMDRLFPANDDVRDDYWSICEQLLPHAQECLLLGDLWDTDETHRIPLMSHVATYLTRRRRHSEAKILFERALQMGEQALGLEHPLIAEALYGFAEFYRVQGKYQQAEPLFVRAIRIREHTLGAGHPSVADTCERLGSLYQRQGKYEQAKSLYQQALSILEQAVSPNHPLVAYSLSGLGTLYHDQGHYEQAEPLYQQALHIWEQAFGPDNPNIAPILNNLGALYGEQGEYEQAKSYYQQALHMWERVLGHEHTNVTYALNGLGELYCKQGKYEQAEPLHQRALHICEQAFGLDHPLVALPLHGLANLYREQGKYEQAKPFYQRALTIRQQHLGPKHPEVADTLYDQARFHRLQQQSTEALSAYQQALTICEQALGHDHPKTCQTRTDYAQYLNELGRTDKAERLTQTPSLQEHNAL